jgi:o-succinylbenzoate synthase
MLRYSFFKKVFQFKNPSGTSRGIMTQKKAWFIELWEDELTQIKGIGECSIIEGLSPDYVDDSDYENKLNYFLKLFVAKINIQNNFNEISEIPEIKKYASILFGIETAFIDLQNGGKSMFFETAFTKGKKSLAINGLIWMGSEDFMRNQIEEKINEGYTCIKMKIGAIDFEKEYQILKNLRNNFSSNELILRVDANGAFEFNTVEEKLNLLSELDLHSIEQPIKAGNWKDMAKLCQQTNLPIALDEELIGIIDKTEKIKLLETIKPQFIILKPSLHGGLSGTQEWISLAENLKIPWWITSALESNIGLNVIAQFTATFPNDLHQGLGTGSLYEENFQTNLILKNGKMSYKVTRQNE